MMMLAWWSAAWAAGPNVFLAGAGTVEIAQTVDVPLVRGTPTDFRPAVRARVGESDTAPEVLAIVDVAYGWTRLGRDLARTLGVRAESTTLRDDWTQTATLAHLAVGGAVFKDLVVEVVEGGDLVLGFGTLPEVAVAVLPSTGTVRIVPAAQGAALIAEVGQQLFTDRETSGGFKFAGEKVYGNGLSLSVPGTVGGRKGQVVLRTDVRKSRVTRTFKSRGERRRKGVVHYRGRGTAGSTKLSSTWLMRDESFVDSRTETVGALGYDLLYGVDLAVFVADGTAAIRPVKHPKWAPATLAATEITAARYKAAGYTLEEESTRPPRMGFTEETSNPEGDPGDAERQRHERSMADALWQAGQTEEALRHYREATKHAGDHCEPYRELGLKRLAWSGRLQRQSFIQELIRQPLREAGDLWDLWAELTPATREKIRRYEDVPSGTFGIAQDVRCRTAWGTLMAAYVRQGDTQAASEIYKKQHGTDPLVAFAQGLSLLSRDQPRTAEIPIREALSYKVEEHPDVKLGLGAAQAGQGLQEPVFALLRELPDLDSDHDLTAALIAASWGRSMDPKKGAKRVVDTLLDTDETWVPGQLLGLWLQVKGVDQKKVAQDLAGQIARDAGSPQSRIHHALHRALSGDVEGGLKGLKLVRSEAPPSPDLYAALAWMYSLAGDDAARDRAIEELGLRFPTIPIGDLGVLQSVR